MRSLKTLKNVAIFALLRKKVTQHVQAAINAGHHKRPTRSR